MMTNPSSQVALWLRLEGLAVLALSILLYAWYGHGWLLFVVLLLAPDLSMLGYLRGPRTGAVLYNVFHTYAVPLLLAVGALLLEQRQALPFALIWTAHIGMDRMLGYGLKLPTGFQETHLGRIGRAAPAARPAATGTEEPHPR